MLTLTDGTNAHPDAMKVAFLHLFQNIANVTRTCELLKLTRRTVYHWINEPDGVFKKMFEESSEMALGVLEDEAMRRAVTGVQKPVFQGGQKVGEITEYSDTLLIVLLKARSPKYKDRASVDLNLPDELKIVHVHSPVPLANKEDDISLLDYEEIPKTDASM